MIRKILFIIAAWLLFSGMQAASPTSQEIITQLLRNATGGIEIHNINGQTSYSGFVGTGYVHYFYENKAYIRPDIAVKWGELRFSSEHQIRTTSIALPVTVGYHVLQQNNMRMTLFGGGRYEQFLRAESNNNANNINNSQVGLTTGASLNFSNRFGINASYYHGLTSLFRDGSGKITSFSFSFNF